MRFRIVWRALFRLLWRWKLNCSVYFRWKSKAASATTRRREDLWAPCIYPAVSTCRPPLVKARSARKRQSKLFSIFVPNKTSFWSNNDCNNGVQTKLTFGPLRRIESSSATFIADASLKDGPQWLCLKRFFFFSSYQTQLSISRKEVKFEQRVLVVF